MAVEDRRELFYQPRKSDEERSPKLPLEKEAKINFERLRKNPYPGRGIIMGIDESGENVIHLYFVEGRSNNSRNRILAQVGETIETKPYDEAQVEDPRLIIYTAMTQVGDTHVVANGDQSTTIADSDGSQRSVRQALQTRTYEPDPPNFTPRITGLYNPKWDWPFKFSLIRKNRNTSGSLHFFHSPQEILPGSAYCFHTYRDSGNPLPSFEGSPYIVPLNGSIEEIARTYWDVLNPEFRVALVVKMIQRETGQSTFKIINRL